ncbi:MAG: PAS domain S-box protein [Polyangiaceae bacterium]
MVPGPILVVDDDAVSRHVLVQALAAADLPHVAVASGGEALAELDSITPSLVLLDLVMPPPDGYAILRILRSRAETRDLPVVVLTALDADQEIARAFESGADDFVRKPFRPVELVARIKGQLRLRGMVTALEKKEKDAQIVLELTQALASKLDFRSILFTVVQRIAEVAKVDRVSIILARETGDVGYVVAASDDESLRDLPIDLAKYPEIQKVLTSRDPLVIRDTEAHPLMEIVKDAQPSSPFSAVAILPILFRDKPTGVLFLRAKHAFVFGDHEIALFRTVTNAMAIALKNAKVLQSLKDEKQQEVTAVRADAEKKLQTLQRYADFFDSAADGIVVMDTDGKMLFSNAKAQAISGYTESEIRAANIGDLISDSERPLAKTLREGFLQGRFPQNVDVPIRTKHGVNKTLSVNFNSVLREEGAIVCTFRDVTQERAVEAELVKTKEFLQRVIDSSSDAIVSADTKGRVLLSNRAAERIYRRTAEEMAKTHASELYPEGVAKELMRMIREGGGRIDGFKTEILTSKGEAIPVALSATLLYQGDTVIGSVGIFTDLRDRVRMEARLAHAQEQLLAQERQAVIAELAGATAHELNQPLTSIIAYAELLKRRLENDPSSFASAEVIYTEADRMAEIVRKIGKITKYETKHYMGRARILDLDRASDDDEVQK